MLLFALALVAVDRTSRVKATSSKIENRRLASRQH